jgi:DNA polymerase-4
LIARNLVELTENVVASMKEEGYRGRTVTVKVRFTDFKTYTRAKTLDEFTDSELEIRRAAFGCLGRLELKKKVRLIR